MVIGIQADVQISATGTIVTQDRERQRELMIAWIVPRRAVSFHGSQIRQGLERSTVSIVGVVHQLTEATRIHPDDRSQPIGRQQSGDRVISRSAIVKVPEAADLRARSHLFEGFARSRAGSCGESGRFASRR